MIHENGTLEINVAQPLNSGKYTCIASNNLGIKENHVFLEVKGQRDLITAEMKRLSSCFISTASTYFCPPEPTRIMKQPEYKVVQRGMSAVFECKVKHDASLIPTMTWLKDKGELPDDERYSKQALRLRLEKCPLTLLCDYSGSWWTRTV